MLPEELPKSLKMQSEPRICFILSHISFLGLTGFTVLFAHYVCPKTRLSSSLFRSQIANRCGRICDEIPATNDGYCLCMVQGLSASDIAVDYYLNIALISFLISHSFSPGCQVQRNLQN